MSQREVDFIENTSLLRQTDSAKYDGRIHTLGARECQPKEILRSNLPLVGQLTPLFCAVGTDAQSPYIHWLPQ